MSFVDVGLTGGLAAPFLAAGAGAIIGGAGAAALGSAAGVAIIGSLFGVAGAGLGGIYFLFLDYFRFFKVLNAFHLLISHRSFLDFGTVDLTIGRGGKAQMRLK